MFKWIKRILLAIGIVVVGFGVFGYFVNKNAYTNLPADGKPILELPIDKKGKIPEQIMPMGETINHEAKSGGHPGIDFQWYDGDDVKIYASMDSEVTGIFRTEKTGLFDLATRNGKWSVDYTELESVNPLLKIGSIIKVGEFVGVPNHPKNNYDDPKFRMIHWQFGYADKLSGTARIRLCPMIYFSPTAKAMIEQIWAETDWVEMKANAPEICANYYKDRYE